MKILNVNFSKKGQLKIQQMAFVLVAMMIFFAIVFLFYFSIRYSSLQGDVSELRKQEVIETVRKISGTPEFSWTESDCSGCIDLDKVLMLKNRTAYEGFWKKIALLKVVRLYPTTGKDIECTTQNYPNCDSITIIEEDKNFQGYRAFVALCRYEGVDKYSKCEMGKVLMAFESVE